MSISVDLHRPVRHPNWRFMMSSPLHVIALGFGSGLSRFAPGTFGTVFACLLFWVVQIWVDSCSGGRVCHLISDWLWPVLIILGFLLGCWACQVTGKRLGSSDHGAMVWDEIVAMCLVLYILPKTWTVQVFGFLVFRAIDIIKPQPIRYFDKKWKNGFGVMFDDLLAAGITLLLMAICFRIMDLPVAV
jgi:phosphatidylglycerophosphatase A